MLQYFKYLIPFVDPQVRNWTWEARLLNWLTCIWLLVGLITLISASYPEGIIEHQDGFYIFKRQLIGIIIGVIAFNIVTNRPLKDTLKYLP